MADRERYATGWLVTDWLTAPYWSLAAWWQERRFWRVMRVGDESWRQARVRSRAAFKQMVDPSGDDAA